MIEEMVSHLDNGTWELYELPEPRQVLTNRWIYCIKTKAENVYKTKPRLIVQGFRQNATIDCIELFSSIAHYDTIRTVLNVTTIQRLILRQFDFTLRHPFMAKLTKSYTRVNLKDLKMEAIECADLRNYCTD